MLPRQSSSLKVKFEMIQKLSCSQGITQTTMTEPKTIRLPQSGGRGGRHNSEITFLSRPTHQNTLISRLFCVFLKCLLLFLDFLA